MFGYAMTYIGANMTSDDWAIERAKQLHAQGFTYKQIGDHPDILRSERTIYRWLSGDVRPRRQRRVIDRTKDSWPDWSLDDLADIHRGDPNNRAAWESNLALISTARAQGRTYIPRFFRSLVEVTRESSGDPPPLDWLLAIAGLPILGEWLGIGERANEIASLIREHRPWTGRNPLRAYQRAATEASEVLKSSIYTAQATETARNLGGVPTPSAMALGGLYQRVPRFDKLPVFTIYRMRSGQAWLATLSSVEEK
jgi:hypothetical protein